MIFLSVAMKQASFDMMCDVQDFMKNEYKEKYGQNPKGFIKVK